MGCVYSIVVYGDDADALPGIVEAGLDEVDRVDRLMSHYKPQSPLSRLNREAALGPVVVDPELLAFLAACLRWSEISDGAFDITVGPLMKTWGFFRGEGRVPDDRALAEAREKVGWRHVGLDLEKGTASFDRPGVELDLGGIAKGYAVDRVVDGLRKNGVAAALVSAGGSTVYGLGAPPGTKGWRIAIEDPLDARRVAQHVWLEDRALSVSGPSRRSFEAAGRRYSHLMDPRRGQPVEGVLSAVVLSSSGTAGDALDNALVVLGVDEGRKLLRRLPLTEAFLFLPETGGKWRLVRLGG